MAWINGPTGPTGIQGPQGFQGRQGYVGPAFGPTGLPCLNPKLNVITPTTRAITLTTSNPTTYYNLQYFNMFLLESDSFTITTPTPSIFFPVPEQSGMSWVFVLSNTQKLNFQGDYTASITTKNSTDCVRLILNVGSDNNYSYSLV
jgi:hypothetical protein